MCDVAVFASSSRSKWLQPLHSIAQHALGPIKQVKLVGFRKTRSTRQRSAPNYGLRPAHNTTRVQFPQVVELSHAGTTTMHLACTSIAGEVHSVLLVDGEVDVVEGEVHSDVLVDGEVDVVVLLAGEVHSVALVDGEVDVVL
eukprot:6491232-Amphidinium_carterae.1